MPDYFTSSANRGADKGASKVFAKNMHNEYRNLFSGIVFYGKFNLQVMDDSTSFNVFETLKN